MEGAGTFPLSVDPAELVTIFQISDLENINRLEMLVNSCILLIKQ